MKPNERPELLDADSPKIGPVDQNRRKLAGFGASAIFTLASRPVLADVCNAPSAHASGNTSHHGAAPVCNGQTTGYYAETFSQRDSADALASTTESATAENSLNSRTTSTRNPNFHQVFKSGRNANWGSKSFSRVLRSRDNGNSRKEPNPISKEFVAALLNIRGGLIPEQVLTEGKLMGMWNEWVDSGIYRPQAGMQWNGHQIVSYLQSLQA